MQFDVVESRSCGLLPAQALVCCRHIFLPHGKHCKLTAILTSFYFSTMNYVIFHFNNLKDSIFKANLIDVIEN